MTRMDAAPPLTRRRVEWPAGDPKRERARWGADAVAYCHLMKRPAAARVAAVLPNYLNSEDGYAWVTDTTIAEATASNNIQAVERALKILDHELGLIERDTKFVPAKDGMLAGRRRLIFATRPDGIAEALAASRAGMKEKAARRDRRSPNPQSETPNHQHSGFGIPNPHSANENQEKSDGCNELRVREAAPDQGAHRTLNHRTLNRTPNGSGYILDLSYLSKEEDKGASSSKYSGFGEAARSVAHRSQLLAELVEKLSLVGPSDRSTTEEAESLLIVGREVFAAIKSGRLAPADAATAVEHVQDAANRAWIEHHPDVKKMLAHLGRMEVAA